MSKNNSMESKKTLVVGASDNPERYAFKAITELRKHNHEVVAYGNKEGIVSDVSLTKSWNPNWVIDTVTLYVGPKNQLIALNPKRVIFNPGTENNAFYVKLRAVNIDFEEACTLVLLATKAY
jgi:hypothetical protein